MFYSETNDMKRLKIIITVILLASCSTKQGSKIKKISNNNINKMHIVESKSINDSGWRFKIDYYTNNGLTFKTEYFDSLHRQIKFIDYYTNGNIKAYVNVKDSVFHGKRINYFRNGKVKSIFQYYNNVPAGLWRYYNDSAGYYLSKIELFSPYKKNAIYLTKEFRPDGSTKNLESGVYVSSKQNYYSLGEEIKLEISPSKENMDFIKLKACIGNLEPYFILNNSIDFNCYWSDSNSVEAIVIPDTTGTFCVSGFLQLQKNYDGEKSYTEPLFFHHCIEIYPSSSISDSPPLVPASSSDK